MRNLLLNAVEELIVKANNEIDEARADIAAKEHIGARVNRTYEAHAYIIHLIDRINVLKDNYAIEFPEDEDVIKKINKAVNIILIQIEDVLNVAYNVCDSIIDDDIESIEE